MKNFLVIFISALLLLFGCFSKNTKQTKQLHTSVIPLSVEVKSLIDNLNYQMLQTKTYDASYVELAYPNGDVPINTGVCADVIIRALRANTIDLQKEMHEDMSQHFSAYPNKWNLKSTDRNIDHRRVPNQMKFFERNNKSKPITNIAADYLPGDIVAWMLPNNLYHVGMVSDELNELGIPVMVHNIGSGTKKADVLFNWKIIGHYRWFDK